MLDSSSIKTVLIVGASRGFGYAMAEEYLRHGWRVVGTVHGESENRLHDLAARSNGFMAPAHRVMRGWHAPAGSGHDCQTSATDP